jgi:uncharacterized cupin superfamily protein
MPVTHESEMEWTELSEGETQFRRKQLGEAAEGELLGCSLYELPPGRKSWPYHYHTANEEALYVLAGTGRLRHDGESYDLRAGSYATFPAEASGGHRVVNDSDEPLRYLVVSTMNDPDLTVYPDSGKFGVYVGAPPGGRSERSLSGYYNRDDDVDYWDGE